MWSTHPWDFGGDGQGNIVGDGLQNEGCVGPAPDGGSGAERWVTLDPSTTFQTMDGFGAAMTESSAYLIWNHPRKQEVVFKTRSITVYNTIVLHFSFVLQYV